MSWMVSTTTRTVKANLMFDGAGTSPSLREHRGGNP